MDKNDVECIDHFKLFLKFAYFLIFHSNGRFLIKKNRIEIQTLLLTLFSFNQKIFCLSENNTTIQSLIQLIFLSS